MNSYDFGAQLGRALEKDAGLWDKIIGAGTQAARGVASGAKNMAQRGAKVVRQEAMDAASKAKPAPRVNTPNALAIPGPHVRIPSPPKPTIMQRAGDMGGAALDEGLTALDNLGRTTRHYAGQAVDAVKNRFGRAQSPQMYQQRLRYVNPDERALIPHVSEGSRELAQGARNFKFYEPPGRTWGNIGTGAGVGLGAAAGLTAVNPFRGDGTGEPSAQNINSQQLATQAVTQQHGAANPNAAGAGGGLMSMWNSLPTEARYAIGAGVPLALAGAFMGGRGNYGMGGAMGALGLGAAGLGAAGAGMFGDGARRMVGQGANALYNTFGGGKGGNPMDQINALGKLSPEFGTTMLMGRDPNMSSDQGRQMYDFLTHNKNIIEQLMPQLQNSSLTGVKQGSALEFGMKIARCWTGYEPVPGKKPYSNDSCRPAGSKKKKEKKAVSSAARGKTQMSCTPSSRGTSKPIDDKQRETNSPVPVGAGNVQQTSEKVSAVPFMGAEQVPPTPARPKAKLPVKKPVAPTQKIVAASFAEDKNANVAAAFGRMIGRGVSAVPALGAAAYYGACQPQLQSSVQMQSRSPIVQKKAAALPDPAIPPSVAVWGGTLPKPTPKPKHAAKPQIPQSVSTWGAAPAQGPVNLPNQQAARAWGGM
jgi:hypothetical protein